MTADGTPAVDLDAIRARLTHSTPAWFRERGDLSQAVTSLERDALALLGMVDTLTAALAPFVVFVDNLELAAARLADDPKRWGCVTDDATITYDDLVRARAALAGTSPTPPISTAAGLTTRHEAVEGAAGPATETTAPTPPARDLAETVRAVIEEFATKDAWPDEVEDLARRIVDALAPTRDLAALADEWEARGDQAEVGPDGVRVEHVIGTIYYACAAELRAALGVPRSAGHKEDPVMSATPGMVGGAPITEPERSEPICSACGEGGWEPAPGGPGLVSLYEDAAEGRAYLHTSCWARAFKEEHQALMERLAESEAADPDDPDTTGGDA